MKVNFANLKPPEVPRWSTPSGTTPLSIGEYADRYSLYLSLYEKYMLHCRKFAEQSAKLQYTPVTEAPVPGQAGKLVLAENLYVLERARQTVFFSEKLWLSLPPQSRSLYVRYRGDVPQGAVINRDSRVEGVSEGPPVFREDLSSVKKELVLGSPTKPSPPSAKSEQDKKARKRAKRRRQRANRKARNLAASVGAKKTEVQLAKAELQWTLVSKKQRKAVRPTTGQGVNKSGKPNRKARRYAIYGPPKGSSSNTPVGG